MAKILKLISIVFGVGLLLVIVSFVCLVMFVSPNWLKPVLAEQVKKNTGRELTIDGDLSWTFYPYLGVKVGHAVLNNPVDFKQTATFAEITSATVGVKLMPLLQGQIESNGITLYGAKINLIKNQSGKNNWALTTIDASKITDHESVASNKKSGMAFGLAISAFDVVDSSIVWIDEQAKRSATINNFAFHATKINLIDAFPVAVEFKFATKNPAVFGNVNLKTQLAFSLNKQIYSLRNLHVDLQLAQSSKSVNLSLDGNLAVDLAQDKLQSSDLKGKIANLDLIGKVNIVHLMSTPEMQGHFYIPIFDLKDFIREIGYDSANLQVAKNVMGNLDFIASAKLADVSGNFKVEQLQAAKIKINKVEMKMHYVNGVLDLAPVTGNLYQGTLEALLAVNFNNPAPQYMLKAKLLNVEAEPLLQDLSEAEQKIKMLGAGNIDLSVSSSGKENKALMQNLNGTGHIAFNNGALSGIDIGYLIDSASAIATQNAAKLTSSDKTNFGNLTGSFVIHNGILTNDDLVLNSPRFDTKGKGTINLIDQTIDYSLQAAVKDSQISAIKNLSGLTIPIQITGNLSNPRVRLDTVDLLKGVAVQQIEKHKEQIKKKIQEQLPGKAGELLQNLLQ